MAEPRKLLVIGLGNVLCGDDGLGVAALERFCGMYDLPENVEAADGGTLGLALLSCVSEADDLVIVDAIQADAAPGSFVRLAGEEVAPAVRERLSVHQVGVADLLDALRLLDAYPRSVVLLGLVPSNLELHFGCTPEVERHLPDLARRIAEEVRASGYPLHPRGERASPAAHDLGHGPGSLVSGLS